MKHFKKSRLISAISLSLFAMAMLGACSGSSSRNEQKEESVVTTPIEISLDTSEEETAPVAGLPTVIDFYATWCGPCNRIAPLFEELKSKYKDKMNFRRVDVDIDEAEAAKYQISAMPTFVFLDAEGKEVDRFLGADEESLRKKVLQYMKK